MNIKHFQKHLRWYELAFIGVVLVLNTTILATSIIMEALRQNETLPFYLWEPFAIEYTSAIATFALVPLIAWLIDLEPPGWARLKRTLAIYFLASIAFSVAHVLIMVVLRKMIFTSQGLAYDFGNLMFEFIYEYRKDFWSFISIASAIWVIRFVVHRLQGEASIVDNGEDQAKVNNPDRILVKKLGKEFIVKIADIEWLESSGNYVNLHIKGRIYPTRSTLSGLIEKIADQGFCRIHRSFAVNLNAIESITPLPGGDGEVQLLSGKMLYLSRRYKDQFKESLH